MNFADLVDLINVVDWFFSFWSVSHYFFLGFGDHDLKAQSNGPNPVYIKPFLTPQPEVRVLDVENEEVTEADVLVMATDGLWDVVSNDRVAQIVDNGLRLTQNSEEVRQKYKFISIGKIYS